MHKTIPAMLVLASATAFTYSCARTHAESRDAQGSTAPAIAVAQAKLQNLAHTVVLTAEFKPYQEVDVMAKVAGYIKQINVDVGDRVAQGQLLATLEVPELGDDLRRAGAAAERTQADVARANDELRRAESSHELAHLSYQRISAVSQKRPGLVAQQEIDDARSKDLVSEAQVAAAKSALAAATEQVHVSSADVQKIKTMIDYTRVTAPFAGVITKRFADTGSMIQAGTASQTQAMPVVRLSENTRLRLILPVPESAVPTVRLGQPVEVRVPTLHRSFPGTVARFADKVSLATRTMDTEVDVPNPSLVLIPGMYAEVDLTLAQHKSVIAVPVMAVDRHDQNGASDTAAASVMVVTPNHRVEMRQVALGMETAQWVEVRSGLNEGDTVVLSGRSGLRAGDEVRPKLSELAASE